MYLNDPKTSWWFDDCVSCMLFEGLEFQKYEMYSVLPDIDHISVTPRCHTGVDFDKKTPVEVVLWRYYDEKVRMSSKQQPHTNKDHNINNI